MDLNSLARDILALLSSEGSGVSSSTVASSEYKLRATVSEPCYNILLFLVFLGKIFIKGFFCVVWFLEMHF